MTALTAADVAALAEYTVLVAAADIDAADKLGGTCAAQPATDTASAELAAIGSAHAVDRTAGLVVAPVAAPGLVELAAAGRFAAPAADTVTALASDTEAAGFEPVGTETVELVGTEPVVSLDIEPAAVRIGTAAVAAGTDAGAGAEPRLTSATPWWMFAPDGYASSAAVDTARVAYGPSTAVGKTAPWHGRAAT